MDKNIRKPKSAYEQLTNGDKCFLHRVINKLAIVGKEVTAERLAGIMLNAREELKADECQNSGGKFNRKIHDLENPNAAKVARQLERKIIHVFYVEEGEENPFES